MSPLEHMVSNSYRYLFIFLFYSFSVADQVQDSIEKANASVLEDLDFMNLGKSFRP